MIALEKPNTAEVLLGATLAAPLLANLIPYPFLLALALAPAGLSAILVVRLSKTGLTSFAGETIANPVALLLWLLLAFQVLGVLQSSDPLAPRLLRELTVGCTLAFVASAARRVAMSEASALRVFVAFIATLVGFAAACAVLGLLKLLLLERGIMLPLIQWLYPIEYPWGSSLKRDYNFFALSILIGMLALDELWYQSQRLLRRISWATLLGLMAVAGTYAGSRRFWLVAPVVLAAHLALIWWRARGQVDVLRRLLGLILIAGIASAGMVKLIEITPDADFTVLGRIHQSMTEKDADGLLGDSAYLSKPTPGAIGGDFRARASTLSSSSESFGIASRVDRWKYALELVDTRTLLVGAGFSYHRAFGCRFLDCKDIDYPHNAILSSLLYGGVGAFLAAVGFVGTMLILGFRLLRQGGVSSTAGLALATALPFCMLSGDTFSSLPGLTTLAILASLLVRRA